MGADNKEQSLREQLGISCNGNYIHNYRYTPAGEDLGAVPFVLVTGFSGKKRRELADIVDDGMNVTPQLVEKYDEVPMEPRQLESYIKNSCSLKRIGFVVFSYDYKTKQYSCYIPENQKIKNREIVTQFEVKDRFISPPKEQIIALEPFKLPLYFGKQDGLRQIGVRDKGYERVVAEVDVNYVYIAIKKMLDIGYKFLLHRSGCSFVFLDVDKSGKIEDYIVTDNNGKSSLLSSSFEGVIKVIYPSKNKPNGPNVAIGEAFERDNEGLEGAWGRHILLDALPSELKPSPEDRKLWKPLNLSENDRTKLTEKLRENYRKNPTIKNSKVRIRITDEPEYWGDQ